MRRNSPAMRTDAIFVNTPRRADRRGCTGCGAGEAVVRQWRSTYSARSHYLWSHPLPRPMYYTHRTSALWQNRCSAAYADVVETITAWLDGKPLPRVLAI